jgi:hypothetical protein
MSGSETLRLRSGSIKRLTLLTAQHYIPPFQRGDIKGESEYPLSVRADGIMLMAGKILLQLPDLEGDYFLQ